MWYDHVIEHKHIFAGYFEQSYLRQIVEVRYAAMTFEDSAERTLQDDLHRLEIVGWACLAYNIDCRNRSRHYYQDWIAVSDPDRQNP